jgi:GT2 family glycosyltransferase
MWFLNVGEPTANPLVSVIVRTKDRPALLKRALQSIAGQTYRPVEVVLVNDGGCDLDRIELQGILGSVSLNYIRLDENTGRAHAGNVGLENAKGEYIGFLDDDDEFYPDHLRALTAQLISSPSKIAYTDAEVVFIDITERDEVVEKFKHLFYSQDFSPEMLLIQNYIPFICLLFHKSVFDNVRFDESFEIFEDWKILIKLSERHWFEHLKQVTARYVQWCDKSQINRRALSENFSQVAYKKILDQNIGKITPSGIYIHCVNTATEKVNLVNELIKIDSNSTLERMELAAKLKRIGAEKQQIDSEKKQIDAERQRIEAEKRQIEVEKQQILYEKQQIKSELIKIESNSTLERMELAAKLKRIEAEKQQIMFEKQQTESMLRNAESSSSLDRMEFETWRKWFEAEKQQIMYEKQQVEAEKQQFEAERDRLLHELLGFQKELSNSLSWTLIRRYRKIKDRVAPMRSKRRVFYEMMLKSIKVFHQEGMKGILSRTKRKLRFHPGYLRFASKWKKAKPVNFQMEASVPVTYCFTKKPVHIVMPVYNGYEYLQQCVESILRCTDLTTHTLIMIDDKSTDQRAAAYLQKLQKERNSGKIKILFNDSNMGFVKTINKGMKLSPEDVIILNSDTIVTKNWVEKLQRAAYAKPRVATATPLSNYMTINGIPTPFQYNPVPGGMDIDSFAEFLEGVSLRYYPEIPAGVGFCMYIKRDVLQQFNYFDETKFERGYAEETDFCMRTLKKGFVHVIDDATYIYHVGGVSFESVRDPELIKEKNLMIERNLETLRTLHPEYSVLVETALRDGLTPVHHYINLRLALLGENIESALCNRPKT